MMQVLDGSGPVYRINLYNRRFVLVETDSFKELCSEAARLTAEGNIITSVTQLGEGHATPVVKVLTTKEYKTALKEIMANVN